MFVNCGFVALVDAFVAGRADHEGLAPFLRHEDGPVGLRLPEPVQVGESADLVDLGLCGLSAEFAGSGQ